MKNTSLICIELTLQELVINALATTNDMASDPGFQRPIGHMVSIIQSMIEAPSQELFEKEFEAGSTCFLVGKAAMDILEDAEKDGKEFVIRINDVEGGKTFFITKNKISW